MSKIKRMQELLMKIDEVRVYALNSEFLYWESQIGDIELKLSMDIQNEANRIRGEN